MLVRTRSTQKKATCWRHGAGLRKLDPTAAPVSTALGALGMPGMTAYVGLLEIGQPKAGEAIVVAAASGAVGSVVGQIAKIKGCYAVGIARGAEKCRFVANELGFDACVDHRASDFANSSKPLLPRGLLFSRTSAAPCSRRCSRYSTILRAFPYAGSSRSTTRRPRCPGPTCFRCCANASSCVGSSSQISPRKQAEFLRDVGEWVRTGRLKYREDIVKGLKNAPASFLGMLQGKNFGKTW